MNISNQAREFAIIRHGNQKYGDRPYSYHLALVSQVLSDFGYAADEAIAAAGWLHDTLEDTETEYEVLVSEFGKETADIVWAVTNEPGGNRVDRFRKTALKIQSSKKALILKLADRIANTEASLQSNPKLYKMYVKEFALFKELLYNPQDVRLILMWNRLEQLNQKNSTLN